MQWNSVLRENMEHEQLGQQWGIDRVNHRDEDGLLGESINDDKDGVKTRGQGEFLNEVHGDGIPQVCWDWELLQESIGAVSLRL